MKRALPLLLVLVSTIGFGQGIVWRSYKNFAISNGKAPREHVIQTQGAFDTYWRELTGEDAAPRDVDFSKELLIAVQLGSRPSMGFKVIIRSIERTKPNEITVTYEEKKPDPNAITASVMTAPYEIVRVERKTAVGAFVFKKREGSNEVLSGNLVRWRTYQCELVGGGSSEFTKVIRDEREWDRYWASAGLAGTSPRDIDWANEMAIAIHLGNRPTDGYDVVVDEVLPIQGGFGITYIEKAPSLGQRTKRVSTSPYLIIRITRLAGDIQFRKRVWRSDGE